VVLSVTETLLDTLLMSVFMCFQYADQQIGNLKKVNTEISSRNPRTVDGIRIRAEQLERFEEIKKKLDDNRDQIKNHTSYINVKQVVPKLY
jgi:hypothetical protein